MNVRKASICVAVALALFVRPSAAGELPNGWSVTPAGKITPLGTLPLHMMLDPSGRWIAVTNSGWGVESVTIVNASTGLVADAKTIAKTFYGLAFAPDGKTLFVSTAADGGIRRFSFDQDTGALSDAGTWKLGANPSWIAGIAVSPDGKTVYAAENAQNELFAVDASSGVVRWTAKTGVQPYAVVVSPDGRRAFVSDWIGNQITAISTADGAVAGSVDVDAHPNAMILSHDGATLYVACANHADVVAISTASLARQDTFAASLWPSSIEGTAPDGLALSDDGHMLFVSDSDDNAVAAIDLGAPKGQLVGAIPVGWYATDVALSRDGRTLFVLDGNGISGHANPLYHRAFKKGPRNNTYYDANLATGDLERMDVPSASELADGLKRAQANALFRPQAKVDIPPGARKIKHVIYVIKENRTYDQILGDDPRGNGDPALAIFGKRITPNIHRLADEFVLLDNFYEDSFVSADGHNWATAAYATDYVEKLWPADYSDRGRDYDFQGSDAVNPPAGYLWDDARAAGRTVRDYGEDADADPVLPAKPQVKSLEGIVDPQYAGFNVGYSDQSRMDEWLREFRGYEQRDDLPDLEIVYLPDDHTAGLNPKFRTPFAMEASNDYALGRLVEALSRSKYWADTVVFSVEDDAQDGPDHVSDHRSEALVAGGLVRRGAVNHTHFTQCSVLRTIELLLHLQPMSQFDAGARPMLDVFASSADMLQWKASKPNIKIDELNPADAAGAQASMRLDFSRPDAADPAALNRILTQYAAKAKP